MKRRTFIAGLGSSVTWPVVARAQQPAMPVIGWLSSASNAPPGGPERTPKGFRTGLNEAGYFVGR
jgi:putative ABC transport system substrate-binding protein